MSLRKATRIIGGGTGQKCACRERIVSAHGRNGIVSTKLLIEEMEMPASRDIVIGLADFGTFGYPIEGVPARTIDQWINEDIDHPETVQNEPIQSVTTSNHSRLLLAKELQNEIKKKNLFFYQVAAHIR